MSDDPRDGLLLERMTSPAIRAAIDAGRTTALVACGAIEQHGPHLPLFVDSEHGERVALDVARALSDALVAPSIRVGCSEHHMKFAGTISFKDATFEAVCRDYCTSLARHGFRRICFIPSHAGNFAPIDEMMGRLREAAGPRTQVLAFTDLLALLSLWKRVVQEESGLGARVGGHADIAESSIMLALHPELVVRSAATAGFTDPITAEVREKFFREGFHSVTTNGIVGDARGMTAAIGSRCIEEAVSLVVAYIRAQPEPPSRAI